MTQSPKTPSDVDLYVAKRLRMARMGAGLTQESVAASVGVTFQQIQKYENGQNRVTAGRLFQLAALYDTPIQRFFPTELLR